MGQRQTGQHQQRLALAGLEMVPAPKEAAITSTGRSRPRGRRRFYGL